MFDYESKLVDSSRILADILVADIGDSQDKYSEMMAVAMLDKYPVSMRAARILTLCTSKNPTLIRPHIKTIIQSLESTKVEGVRRGFFKILSEVPDLINEECLGLLADLAFDWMGDPKQAIAIRVYAIDLLLHVVKKYPDLRYEFVGNLETIMEDGSSGLKSKCKHTLRKLNNIRR